MSVDIVKDYACSKSSLNSFLTLRSFSRLFPKGISEQLVLDLYEALETQRREVANDVSRTIEKEFKHTLKTDSSEESLQATNIDYTPFAELLDQLVEVSHQMEPKVSQLERQSDKFFQEIRLKMGLLDSSLANIHPASTKIPEPSGVKQLSIDVSKCEDELMNK